MLSFIKKLCLSTAVFAAASQVGFSQAADLDPDYNPQIVEHTAVEFGTGWYMRGDIGVGRAIHREDSGVDAWDDDNTIQVPSSFSIGAGVKLTNRLRADFTLERFGDLSSNQDGGACDVSINAGDCNYSSRAEATAIGFMANVYWDFGSSNGFNPYVGAGVGVANVDWSSFTVAGIAADGTTVDAPVVTTESSFRPMFNLQAGAGINVGENLTLDVGYRLVGIYGDSFENTAQPVATRQNHDTGMLLNHEIRVGLRYEIW